MISWLASVAIIWDLLAHYDKFSNRLPLAEKWVPSIYFLFSGKFDQPTCSSSMSSLLFPVVADNFMKASETVALKSSPYKPKV